MDPIILPLIIFLARIAETTAKTIRQVYVGKGYRYLAAAIGTAEIAIWLLSTALVLTHLTDIAGIVAYIAGYAVGTVLGIDLEERLSVGNVIVRIITRSDPSEMVLELREKGFGLTRLDGSGSSGAPVAVLLVIVPRSVLDLLTGTLRGRYPDAIFSVEDIRSVKQESPLFFRPQAGLLSRLLGRG